VHSYLQTEMEQSFLPYVRGRRSRNKFQLTGRDNKRNSQGWRLRWAKIPSLTRSFENIRSHIHRTQFTLAKSVRKHDMSLVKEDQDKAYEKEDPKMRMGFPHSLGSTDLFKNGP